MKLGPQLTVSSPPKDSALILPSQSNDFYTIKCVINFLYDKRECLHRFTHEKVE